MTDFFTVVRQFLNEYPQRGLVIVVSDFLDDAGCEKALQYLADYGNELMLVQLWSDEDRDPPWTGEVDLVDAESGGRLRIQVDDEARKRYTEVFRRFFRRYQEVALRNDGKYAALPDVDAARRSHLRRHGPGAEASHDAVTHALMRAASALVPTLASDMEFLNLSFGQFAALFGVVAAHSRSPSTCSTAPAANKSSPRFASGLSPAKRPP